MHIEKLPQIKRFEVIDRRGRAYIAHNPKLSLSFQDNNTTLKVFLGETSGAILEDAPLPITTQKPEEDTRSIRDIIWASRRKLLRFTWCGTLLTVGATLLIYAQGMTSAASIFDSGLFDIFYKFATGAIGAAMIGAGLYVADPQ